MKKIMSVMALGLALMFGFAATVQVSAQEVNRTITIRRDTKLGTELLPKGEYAIKFVDGKDGEVVFMQGRHEVLKATFTLTKLDKTPSDSVVVSSANDDGSFQLKRIEVKGKSTALVFENTVAKLITK
jgi:hypothetical protein